MFVANFVAFLFNVIKPLLTRIIEQILILCMQITKLVCKLPRSHMNKLFLIFPQAQLKQFHLPSNMFNVCFLRESNISQCTFNGCGLVWGLLMFRYFCFFVRVGFTNSALYAIMTDDLAVQNDVT